MALCLCDPEGGARQGEARDPGTQLELRSRHQHLDCDQISLFATRNWPSGDKDTGVCSAPGEGTGKSLVGPRATVEKGKVWGRTVPGLVRETGVQTEHTWWKVGGLHCTPGREASYHNNSFTYSI